MDTKDVYTKTNDNGSYVNVTVREQTPEDGFVDETKLHPGQLNQKGRHFRMGYGKNFSVTTNDPRVTRPFAYGMSTFFIVLGLLVLLTGGFVGVFIGGMALFIGVVALKRSKEDIDRIEKELKEKQEKQ